MSIKYVSDINQISNDISNKYGDKLIKVVYPKSYLIKFEKIISTIYTFIFVIGIVVLVVSIFNVSNIIKLSLESRKDIITTLKLHGANKIFIRAPFIIEGLLHGFFGTIFASSLLISFLVFGNDAVYSLFSIKVDYDIKILILILGSISFFVTIIGSSRAVSKFLK